MDLALNNHVQLAVDFVNVNCKGALVLATLWVQAGCDILKKHGWLFPAILVAKLFSLNFYCLIRILNHRSHNITGPANEKGKNYSQAQRKVLFR